MMMMISETGEIPQRRVRSPSRVGHYSRTLEKDFPVLSYMTAPSHIQPFKLNYIELKFRSLVTLAIFQVLERHMQQVARILDRYRAFPSTQKVLLDNAARPHS